MSEDIKLFILSMLTLHKHLETPRAHARLLFVHSFSFYLEQHLTLQREEYTKRVPTGEDLFL